jgi:hypothetical protein
MNINSSILLALLQRIHPAHAQVLSFFTASKGRETRSSLSINRHLKKGSKPNVADAIERDFKKAGCSAKGDKRPVVKGSSERPSETQTWSREHEVSVDEYQDVPFPSTSFPSPWPTYNHVEDISEFPTDAQIGLDMDLVVGIRTPECPPLMGQATTPRPIEIDTLEPTTSPTPRPSRKPSLEPTSSPTSKPTLVPTPKPVDKPSTTSSNMTFERGALKKTSRGLDSESAKALLSI